MDLEIEVLNADHSTPAYNATKALQIPTFTHCFPHTIRKPADTRNRHLINGSKEQKDAFIEVAKEDIRHLHRTKSTAQMRELWRFTSDDWKNQRFPRQVCNKWST